jgi:hypothetical protein
MHASVEKDRFRQGLGRSTDPKVVALRQAVLDKCVAIKGPSPGQGDASRTLSPHPHLHLHAACAGTCLLSCCALRRGTGSPGIGRLYVESCNI